MSTLVLAIVGLGFSTIGAAQMDHSMHGTPTAQPVAVKAAAKTAEVSLAEGLVKKIDKTKGTVTLAHGSLNGMPPMTMAYKVKDATWLDKLQVGQKIRFTTDPDDGGMTVLRYELAK
jgi:Cu/Ag efflux protein CusF